MGLVRTGMLVAAAVVVTLLAQVRAGAAADDVVSLAVPGRANAAPWVAAAGSFVAVAWGGTAAGKADVFVAVSRDAARTFAAPVRVNTTTGEGRLGGEMPPRVVLRARSGADPEMVVLWTARGESTAIRTARSLDGGRTFAPGVALQSAGAAGDRGWPALALDAQGTAHAIWLDHRGLAKPAGQPAHDHHEGTKADGVAMAQKSGLYYASSSAETAKGTVPFSAVSATSPEHAVAMGVCYCCKTALVAAADGSLFAAWRHVYDGNLRDIAFSASRDGGRTFSSPLRVSQDQWAINGCPDDGPAMVVDGAGTIHIVWPTVVSGPTPEGAIFYASSRDGKTFSERVRVPTLGSPKPSHPQIAVDARGRIVVAWDEAVAGQRTAVMREVRRAADRVSFGDPITLAPQGPAVYPMIAATGTSLVAAWTSGTGESSSIAVRTLALP